MSGLIDRLADLPDRDLLRMPEGAIRLAEAVATGPGGDIGAADRVLVSVGAPSELARTLLALDGRVAALLLASDAFAPEVIAALAAAAGITRIVTDRDDLGAIPGVPACPPAAARGPARPSVGPSAGPSAWLMTTSGTTGVPKIVAHSLASLGRTVRDTVPGVTPVWGLVYDMTRFAGMQVALQALLGHGVLAVADTGAPLAAQVAFLHDAGTTHLSATPTLWRRLLMVPGIERLALRQITLGGEIVDQPVLDAVAARFPAARLTHIYASTEAGVGFAVNDRRAGFPSDWIATPPAGVELAVRDDVLWLRPPGHRARYLGDRPIETDADGFVRSGDRLRREGARFFFLGRDTGTVNVGGVKIHPEHVEQVIAAVPGVAAVQVTARANPIMGNLLVATIVPAGAEADRAALKAAVQAACRAGLEREANPATIRFAEALATNSAGKILRG